MSLLTSDHSTVNDVTATLTHSITGPAMEKRDSKNLQNHSNNAELKLEKSTINFSNQNYFLMKLVIFDYVLFA